MTNQEIFDRAYLGVIAQEEPCLNPTLDCVYWFDGKMCAIGHAVGEEKAKEFANGYHLGYPKQSDIGAALKQKKPNFVFLSQIQHAHDRSDKSDFLNDYKEQMSKIAEQYGLTIPSV